jgi:methyl-accepting chemotaxis protein
MGRVNYFFNEVHHIVTNYDIYSVMMRKNGFLYLDLKWREFMKDRKKPAARSIHLSLQWKMITVCVLLLVIPGLIIGLTGYYKAKSELDESGRISLKQNVDMTIHLIEAYQSMVQKGAITLEDAQEQVRIRAVGAKKADGKTREITNKIGEYGYVFAIDAKGVDVMHPSREGENTWESKDENGVMYVQEIIRNGTAAGGYSYYQNKLPNTETLASKVTFSRVDPHWGWVVAAGSYMQDFNAGSEVIRHIMIYLLAGFIAAGSIIAALFARHISKPVHRITQQVEQMASGHLQLPDLKVKNRDEVGRLAFHFNKMKGQMKDLIGSVSESASLVAATGEELLASSEETSRVTEQISLSVQEVAGGAQVQAEIINEISTLASVASDSAKEIALGSETAAASSLEAARTADKGTRSMSETVEHMKLIEDKVQGIERAVMQLEQKSSDVGNIITLISHIAVQTNILALNAGIEAARAGELGKGFAVVATEVKKLAEQTRSASDQVSELIHDIQREVAEAAAATREEAEAVAAGLRLANEADESFKEILQAVELAAGRCTEVAQASYDVTIRMSGLASAVEQISSISAETAGQSENVAGATEEQNASMEEVASAANELSKMADELQRTVSFFQVRDR